MRPAVPLLVVEDHAVIAQSLAMALRLQGFDPVEVVTGAGIGEEQVLAAADDLGAGAVVVLDLHLGGGRLATPMISPLRERALRVLVLTVEQDPRLLAECLDAGADGVFDKAQPFDNLVALLHDAARGFSIMSASAKEELLAVLREARQGERQKSSRFDGLTGREQDVLRGLVSGRNAEEIAREAGIALSTVRSHVKSLLRKLGVNSQLAAVALARADGWGDETDVSPG
jgi:two-component system, NarL family, nitrate/nitrite response regulator NarL